MRLFRLHSLAWLFLISALWGGTTCRAQGVQPTVVTPTWNFNYATGPNVQLSSVSIDPLFCLATGTNSFYVKKRITGHLDANGSFTTNLIAGYAYLFTVTFQDASKTILTNYFTNGLSGSVLANLYTYVPTNLVTGLTAGTGIAIQPNGYGYTISASAGGGANLAAGNLTTLSTNGSGAIAVNVSSVVVTNGTPGIVTNNPQYAVNFLDGLNFMAATGGQLVLTNESNLTPGFIMQAGPAGATVASIMNPSGAVTFDGGGISSDGQSNLTARSFIGNGSGLTGLTAALVGAVSNSQPLVQWYSGNILITNCPNTNYNGNYGPSTIFGGGLNGNISTYAVFTNSLNPVKSLPVYLTFNDTDLHYDFWLLQTNANGGSGKPWDFDTCQYPATSLVYSNAVGGGILFPAPLNWESAFTGFPGVPNGTQYGSSFVSFGSTNIFTNNIIGSQIQGSNPMRIGDIGTSISFGVSSSTSPGNPARYGLANECGAATEYDILNAGGYAAPCTNGSYVNAGMPSATTTLFVSTYLASITNIFIGNGVNTVGVELGVNDAGITQLAVPTYSNNIASIINAFTNYGMRVILHYSKFTPPGSYGVNSNTVNGLITNYNSTLEYFNNSNNVVVGDRQAMVFFNNNNYGALHPSDQGHTCWGELRADGTLQGIGIKQVTSPVAAAEYLGGAFGANGFGLTNLNASQLTGTVPLAALPAAVVTNGPSMVIMSGTTNGDFEVVAQNSSTGTNASTSFYAVANNGSYGINGSNNVQMGINGGNYRQNSVYFGTTNDGYVFVTANTNGTSPSATGGGNLWLGTYNTNTAIILSVGGAGGTTNAILTTNGLTLNTGVFAGNGGGLTNLNYSQLSQIYNPGTIGINTNVFGANATAWYSGPVTNQYRFEITVTTGSATGNTSSGMITNTPASPLFEAPMGLLSSSQGINAQIYNYNNGPLMVLTNTVNYTVWGIKNNSTGPLANTVYIWDFSLIP